MRINSPSIQGFTLLELLVVVSLMAVLATAALIANEGVNDRAEEDATRYEMAELRKALLQFRRDVGHFPATLNFLVNCQVADDAACITWNPDTHRGWNGPYVSAGSDKDAWGHDYLLFDPSDTTPSNDADGVARLVSVGFDEDDDDDGTMDAVENAASDSCDKITNSDDIVLCLLK